MRPRTRRRLITALLRLVAVTIILAFSVGPVLYGLLLSFRPLSTIVNEPLNLIPKPSEIDWSSYALAMGDEKAGGFGLTRFMVNSFVVSFATVAAVLLVSILGAYAATRLAFRGRSAVNVLFLSIYLFPGIVLAVPLFVMMSRIGMTGTLPGLVLIYVAQTVPVAIYMLRNYFGAISESIEEAAMVDGCGRMGLIRRIVLPLALPGIAATALYIFMIAWNEYLFALLFLVAQRDRWTVALGIARLTEATVPAPVLLAGSITITIPVLLAFFLAQKLLVSGLTAGAEKG